jgi:methyl-accepting chemotaxis protein
MHLEDIQGQTDRVVCEMAAMEETADEGMATAEDTLDALSLISETVEETVDGVEEISHATTELTGSAEEIADSADHMARVSDETIGRAERVEHIVEEVTLALGEIYVNTKNLEIETSYLVGILDWFTISSENN